MFLSRRVNLGLLRTVQIHNQSLTVINTRNYSDPPKERDILKIIWNNILNSMRPKQTKGNFMGTDGFGNKYFEIPADPSVGKRRDSRWFEPVEKEKYDQELPAEWEAWLRGRRKVPPTDEELRENQAIADMKKVNAAELEIQYNPERAAAPKEEKIQSFPRYPEYEVMPGEKQDREK